jgi:hypothetical protein
MVDSVKIEATIYGAAVLGRVAVFWRYAGDELIQLRHRAIGPVIGPTRTWNAGTCRSREERKERRWLNGEPLNSGG